MLVRIIDYIGNPGGGVRYVAETLGALLGARADVRFELVSTGKALERYRAMLGEDRLAFVDLPPAAFDQWRYDLAPEAIGECDVAWLPWIHRHRAPEETAGRVVATLHDLVLFQMTDLLADVIPAGAVDNERETIQRWIDSPAHIVVTSNATASAAQCLFRATPDRVSVIPVSAEHTGTQLVSPLPADWAWADRPFMICPANISPHKNHETLLRGVAAWKGSVPLVLTGEATHLHLCRWSRAVTLRQVAEESGLELGKSLLTLGYVPDGVLNHLMQKAWALVMPTLAEGGGSFPVAEAIRLGVPVVCSDIPVIREQMQRMGADLLWFDGHDPMDLARRLGELAADYPTFKAKAAGQIAHLRRRSWGDVANEYWSVFQLCAESSWRSESCRISPSLPRT